MLSRARREPRARTQEPYVGPDLSATARGSSFGSLLSPQSQVTDGGFPRAGARQVRIAPRQTLEGGNWQGARKQDLDLDLDNSHLQTADCSRPICIAGVITGPYTYRPLYIGARALDVAGSSRPSVFSARTFRPPHARCPMPSLPRPCNCNCSWTCACTCACNSACSCSLLFSTPSANNQTSPSQPHWTSASACQHLRCRAAHLTQRIRA